MKFLIIIIAMVMITRANSQEQNALPYRKIPTAPESYSAGNVLGRLVDGLGFRYYWATERLREKDLNYRVTDEARNMYQTLVHLYSLSLTIHNTVQNIANERPEDWSGMTFQEIREQTLRNIQKASQILKSQNEQDLEANTVIFKRDTQQYNFPFWNLINGPISDAIWHCGQVVMMRRASGNPINPKVNVFTGQVGR